MHPRLPPLAAALLALGVAMPSAAEPEKNPAALRPWVSLRFPGTQWATTSELAGWLAEPAGAPLVLLDARAEDEFAVSHLRGAQRVDPESDALDPASVPPGARVVVYCSVGYRSAAVARRLRRAGAERVLNLEGGIFQWANEGRPVYRGDAPAAVVHPYDARWGRRLDAALHAPLEPAANEGAQR